MFRIASPQLPLCSISEHGIAAHHVKYRYTTVCTDQDSKDYVVFDPGSFGIRGVNRIYLFH